MRIRRVLLVAAALALAAYGAPPGNPAGRRFDTKLPTEQRIQQALNRLTFGAGPGDFERAKTIGVEKWIELQLHPERIAENPVLATRLKPLETIRMGPEEILKAYFPQFPPGVLRPTPLPQLLPGDRLRKVLNGTAEERRAAIEALDPEKRMQVLAQVPPNVMEGLGDLKEQQEAARKKRQEEQRAEMRRVRPPLNDLLDAKQIEIATRGTAEQRTALFASLDPAKLKQVAAALPPNVLVDRPEMRRMGMMLRQPQQVLTDDLREAKLFRALYSTRQLEEVLTDFWFNHFNVFDGKGPLDRALLASYEQQAIRPHVLGKFKDLLLATARHPAMLYYLDNWESMGSDVFEVGPFAPGPFGPQVPPQFRRAHGLNENYGRELMELHTLGVNGGYTQQDVIAVARCFTGWTIRQPNQKPEFVFARFMHDDGEKTVLGHKIAAGGGEQDGLEVLDILAHHPSTARFISTELARRFVADDPPRALIDRMARTFMKTDGDLRAVLETMFTSREFFSQGAWEGKVKSPLEMVVSAVRALGADTTDTFILVQRVAEMGEPLYSYEFPTGYKDTAEAWLSTANVLARVSFASALARGQVPGVKVDLKRFQNKDAAAMAGQLLHGNVSPETLAAIQKGFEGKTAAPAQVAGLVLGAPEFQRR